MPKSMTGYGRAANRNDRWAVTWEIRSVNSRHLDLKWKIPHSLISLQAKWEKILRRTAKRGRVELFLNLQIIDPGLQGLSFDLPMAQAMLEQLQQMSLAPHNWEPDINRLLNVPALWKDDGIPLDSQLTQELQQSLQDALQDWDQARIQEGKGLLADLLKRHEELSITMHKIQNLTTDLVPDRFELLQQKVNTLLEKTGLETDSERMLQELAILSDKLDVSEELTRLGLHLQEIKTLLTSGGEMGRKLDFLLQESFREINTCANKAQNVEISHLAVNFKAELEKCREQVQNLE